MTEENKTELTSALDELKKAHSEKNLESLDPAMEKLNETWSKISTELYSKTQTEQSETQTPDNGDQPQDVEFEEVKE